MAGCNQRWCIIHSSFVPAGVLLKESHLKLLQVPFQPSGCIKVIKLSQQPDRILPGGSWATGLLHLLHRT